MIRRLVIALSVAATLSFRPTLAVELVPRPNDCGVSDTPVADWSVGNEAFIRGDFEKACQTWKSLAKQGDARAQNGLAVVYQYGYKNFGEATSWYRKAAEQGLPEAQYNLGNLYRLGKGVPQSYAVAAKWYKKAAEQNHSWAQYNLARLYHFGWGVPQDYAEAVNWYQKAAEQNNTNAQYNLGIMNSEVKGWPEDLVQAHMWFNLAGSQGNGHATVSRNRLAKRMTSEQIVEAQRLAREWEPSTPDDTIYSNYPTILSPIEP
ncbi:MAG: sel1 repeat family protein [Hyphomicrobiales bacterium]|nr:sel1 repeat family protein [Hyphomicrobiales bacterium]